MLASSIGVNVVRYKHNDMEDLEKRLSQLDKEAPKLIATDGVFSTFGGIVKLDELTKLAKEYNANVIVDDAHAFGVIGEGGRGTGHHFGVQDAVDLTCFAYASKYCCCNCCFRSIGSKPRFTFESFCKRTK
eukprot:maker-scaffold9278_size2458-snap-gene-0.0 protein:Tk02943 transcript:maker-scaffold9278_size2458-snap-gene-0.0-mRNA-1 annotation:"2-amino-3-ketobutyrate ligase"